MEVLLFPYLPLAERFSVGQWELIPRADLTADDCSAPDIPERAEGVAALYRLPPGDPRGYGAFVRHVDARVGDDTTGTLRVLGDAVTVALLDRNPSRADPAAEENLNAGHAMCTTEHGLIWGHRIDADGYTAYETGSMVQTLYSGAKIGDHRDLIAPPNNISLPLMRPRLDPVYASALFDVLSNVAEDDPDLAGAIRWLLLAWTNTPTVDEQARILALRAGFDVLFGGAATADIRTKLSALLDEADAPREHRTWIDHGNQREASLTDLEWWFQVFALLRNKVAHGGRFRATRWTTKAFRTCGTQSERYDGRSVRRWRASSCRSHSDPVAPRVT